MNDQEESAVSDAKGRRLQTSLFGISKAIMPFGVFTNAELRKYDPEAVEESDFK
jgi:hypothetical protein